MKRVPFTRRRAVERIRDLEAQVTKEHDHLVDMTRVAHDLEHRLELERHSGNRTVAVRKWCVEQAITAGAQPETSPRIADVAATIEAYVFKKDDT